MKMKGCVAMNAILGARIRNLRETKGLTQEQIAEKMNCTRQKYARLEKGLVDISYASLTTVAQILGIAIEEITSVVDSTSQELPLFRGDASLAQDDKFMYIHNMLDTFYAHRKLYNSVRPVSADE
jgi:transcriptional regulator with XRE-family HTH domain